MTTKKPRMTKWLNDAKAQIETLLLEALGARLNPKKTILQPLDRGVDFQ